MAAGEDGFEYVPAGETSVPVKEANWVVLRDNGKQEIKPEAGGVVISEKVRVSSGANEAKMTFLLPGLTAENCVVQTEGWHSWSKWRKGSGGDVGMKQVDVKTADKEPRVGDVPIDREVIPEGEGRSYGRINFRSVDGATNLMLGTLPDNKYIQRIKFRRVEAGIEIEVVKKLDGPETDKAEFEIYLAKTDGAEYQEALKNYGSELNKRIEAEGVKPVNGRVTWFSWAALGPGETKDSKIRAELPFMQEVGINTMIIDDGWTAGRTLLGNIWGDWEVDTNKFPDMPGLLTKAREMGINPGIWMTPFAASRNSKVAREHPDWIMKDENGKDVRWGTRTLSDPVALDISQPAVREYIFGKMEQLAEMGADVFKLDYLSIVFLGEMQNKDKTSVEYYRDFFREARTRINDKIKGQNRQVEFMGCGAPLSESVGLFEELRLTEDSAEPSMGWVIDTVNWIRGSDDDKYAQAMATAARRMIPGSQGFGLVIDGIHMTDRNINMSRGAKAKMAGALFHLTKIGENVNITVGDSLVRSGESGREDWKEFIRQFKES